MFRALLSCMQGCTGEQLLQLTDKGLLQLGVQDAAERQALLTSRKALQQQQHPEQGNQNPQDEQSSGAAEPLNKQGSTLVMPAVTSASSGDGLQAGQLAAATGGPASAVLESQSSASISGLSRSKSSVR